MTAKGLSGFFGFFHRGEGFGPMRTYITQRGVVCSTRHFSPGFVPVVDRSRNARLMDPAPPSTHVFEKCRLERQAG